MSRRRLSGLRRRHRTARALAHIELALRYLLAHRLGPWFRPWPASGGSGESSRKQGWAGSRAPAGASARYPQAPVRAALTQTSQDGVPATPPLCRALEAACSSSKRAQKRVRQARRYIPRACTFAAAQGGRLLTGYAIEMASAPKSTASRLQGPPAAGPRPASALRLRAASALRLRVCESAMSAGCLYVAVAEKGTMGRLGIIHLTAARSRTVSAQLHVGLTQKLFVCNGS